MKCKHCTCDDKSMLEIEVFDATIVVFCNVCGKKSIWENQKQDKKEYSPSQPQA